MKTLFAALLTFIALAGVSSAQDDTVELSSFVIGRERDSVDKPLVAPPDVAITLRKPATSVVMELNLVNATDKPDVRNREIYATIKALEQAAQASTGIKFERREIQLRGDTRKFSSIRGGTVVSSAVCALVTPLREDADVFALVQRMRTLVAGVPPSGATKVLDGSVGLVLERPDQYRQELLKKIFEDIAAVKAGIGPDFEILPFGLNGPVKVRAVTEREVELWIEYGFTIRSILELKNPAPKK